MNDLINNIIDAAHKNYPKHWQDFKKRWCARGCRWRQALHFLLKYRFRKNWSFEVKEDYLSVTPWLLINSASEHGFAPIHVEAQHVSYIEDLWKKDLGIDLSHPTHGVFVFKNRRFA